MEKAFWQSIIKQDCAVPEGHTIAELTLELLANLGSIDAELRDDIALTILATWIEREGVYTRAELRAIAAQLAHNLTRGIGESGGDLVFLRSFSALVLDCVIDYDNAHPFLEADEVQRFLTQALDYLAREQDLRGYVSAKGWAHSAAHTADLLAILARNPALHGRDLERVLQTIAEKVMASVEHAYLYKEDERLAYTVITALRRNLIAMPFLSAWVDHLASADDAMPWYQAASTAAGACARHNTKIFLRSLYFQLTFTAEPPAIAPELLAKLSEALKLLELVFYDLP